MSVGKGRRRDLEGSEVLVAVHEPRGRRRGWQRRVSRRIGGLRFSAHGGQPPMRQQVNSGQHDRENAGGAHLAEAGHAKIAGPSVGAEAGDRGGAAGGNR